MGNRVASSIGLAWKGDVAVRIEPTNEREVLAIEGEEIAQYCGRFQFG